MHREVRLAWLGVVLGIAACPCMARADIIVRYDFGPTAPASPGNPAPNVVGTGFSGTNISVSPGTSGLVSIFGAATAYGNEPILTLNNSPTTGVLSEAVALASGSYFSFVVDRTDMSATSYNIDNISFGAARGGASTPRGFYLYSSVDGFTSGNAIAIQAIPTERSSNTLTPFSFPLGTQFDNLASSVEFRLYTTTPAGGAHIDFDNLLVEGALNFAPALVPEPSAFVLFGTVAMTGGAVLWRRRRNR